MAEKEVCSLIESGDSMREHTAVIRLREPAACLRAYAQAGSPDGLFQRAAIGPDQLR